MSPHPDWLIPEWDVPATVRAVCTTRAGGCSQGPFAGLNLGKHVGDDSGCVAANRVMLQDAIRARPVFLSQVHGTRVESLTLDAPDGREADAATTMLRGLACTVMVADCLPVLLASADGTVVAAAHAGWRGLLGVNGQGVLEQTLASMRALAVAQSGAKAAGFKAWLGPCIGATAFEVGSEVREAFLATDPRADSLFAAKSEGKWLADLAGLARQRLRGGEVAEIYGNDGTLDWCTASQPSRFFSYRRDGVSGRFAAAIWLA